MKCLFLSVILLFIGYVVMLYSTKCIIDYSNIKTMENYANQEGSEIKKIIITKKQDYIYLDNGIEIILPKHKITNEFLVNKVHKIKESNE